MDNLRKHSNSVTGSLIRSLVLIFLLCGGLYMAKAFLVPLTFGFMLAMLLIPLSRWMEAKGLWKGLSALLCTLLLVIFGCGIVVLLSWQVAGIADDADQIMIQINKIPGMVQEYFDHSLGFPVEKQIVFIKEQSSSFTLKAGDKIVLAAGSTVALLGKSLLVLIYTFLFIFYRKHLSSFVLKMVTAANREVTEKIMDSIGQVAQKYISGLGIMIVVLWIMYGIGFSIIGIKHALFFAILCGLLEIVPYAGNLTGSSITAIMAFTQGGGSMALWVLAVYAIVQFTQTYLLEPLVVGARVSINPLCTIVVIVAGEMLWGIPGMILAIPLLGTVKIICDNIPELQPFGFLIGEVKATKKVSKE